MTPRFLAALDFVLAHETEFARGHSGDYNFVITENDPNDPGGATKYGIDQRSHPEIKVADLTLDAARQIYYLGEWAQTHAEQLGDKWGEVVFDSAVNVGTSKAINWLQRVIQARGLYPGALDNVIGPMTVKATQEAQDSDLRAFLDLRRAYYRNLANSRSSMTGFLKGWLNRVDDLQKFVRV